jgi:hypothetical protein
VVLLLIYDKCYFFCITVFLKYVCLKLFKLIQGLESCAVVSPGDKDRFYFFSFIFSLQYEFSGFKCFTKFVIYLFPLYVYLYIFKSRLHTSMVTFDVSSYIS